MSYMELFSSVHCKRFIIFEDDFEQVACTKERTLYDITRMDLEDREIFLSEVRNTSTEIEEKLSAFLKAFDEVFDSIGCWQDEVVFGDITAAIALIGKQNSKQKEKIERLYADLDAELVSTVYGLGAKFGVGINHSSQYDSLFDEYILFNNRTKAIRIYTEFKSENKESFLSDISVSTDSGCVVCIIDNQLGGEKRASEIIQVVKDANATERKNVIGCVFSTHDTVEEIDKDVYFEYVSKNDIEKLEACIAKSAYNYFLSRLKKETLSGLTQAFEVAQKSKGIAYFLSRKALKEGASEYQIINDWIRLLSTDTHSDSETMKQLISLSRVINSLEDSEDEIDDVFQKLNTLEAFDYTINDYYLPIAAGDIFTDDADHWYVLIGQDCDMARSASRKPNNALSELLPAKIRQQTKFNKWANDLETASIYNFRKSLSADNEILQVEYQHREFLSNEILNLCAFNTDGMCKISLSSELDAEQLRLLPNYMIEYYSEIQKYFSAIQEMKNKANEAFCVINDNKFNPRLFSVCDYNNEDDLLVFKLRRVCRLTHTYVFYLYKLYLEYRGRQPFQTINLVRQEQVTLPVYTNKSLSCFSIIVRRTQDPNIINPKKWCWFIQKDEINRICNELKFGQVSNVKEDIMIDVDSIELPLSNEKTLKIEKAKDKVHFNIIG